MKAWAEISAALERSFKEHAAFLILIIVLVAVLLAPLRIAGYGGTPADDVLRHAAKVISGREWSEVLVFRRGVPEGMDTHPGWHGFLGLIHGVFQPGPDGLVIFSILVLWAGALLPLLIFVRRREILAVVLLIFFLLDGTALVRLLSGRPYILSTGVLMALLFLWDKLENNRRPKSALAAAGLLVALAAWMQSAWYLYALPVAAFFLTLRWRPAVQLALAAGAGIMLGALLTGHPFTHLVYQFRHALWAFGNNPDVRELVQEFQPANGSPLLFIAAGGWLMMRAAGVAGPGAPLRHPAFILAVTGWILGFFVARFWYDWGAPALIVWLCLEGQSFTAKKTRPDAPAGVLLALAASAAFFCAITSNINNRWGVNPGRSLTALKAAEEDLAPWLPAEDGIIYSPDMAVFYNFFYTFPRRPWRYILGFEPGLMPPEDLRVYRRYKLRRSWNDLAPWAEKMRPGDRLIVMSTQPETPPMPQLEWMFLRPIYWIGRPRS